MLAAEYGSLRRTAEALNISQSTVSRRIQLLERRIGISIFERSRSGVRATLAGERFLREAAVGADYLREAVIDHFRTIFAGTWRFEPDESAIRVTPLGPDVAHIYAPTRITAGAAGQEPAT